MRIWDLTTGKALHVLKGHTKEVRTVAFTPDSKRAVSGGRDCTIRVWDLEGGTEVKRIDNPENEIIESLAVSHDGKQIVVGGGSPVVRLRDIETGNVIREFAGHGQNITCVAFSPDGKSLLTSSYDKTAHLWDVASGRSLHVFRGHANWIWSVGFSPDGRRILTAGGGMGQEGAFQPGTDFGIRIWPLPDASSGLDNVLQFTTQRK